MNKIRILLAIFFLLLFLTIGWYLFFRSRSEKLIASGTIEAKEVVVSSKIVGKVTEVMVDEGQETKVGQVLALIDSREAQIAVENAKANFSVAEADLKRHSQLFSQGVITKQQFDRAKANYEVALASLENAKIYLENTVVVSPLSGIVLVRAIEPGELATIGVPIVTIANLNELELVVYLPERDVGRVKIGEEVLVSVDAYPN
ncbi:MAG: efflux RND transporter periplasmic adaptor subunit, partial [Candidatus Margulisiibacteriota bacterium]